MPTEDLQDVAKNLALPGNVTLDNDWYHHNMRLDPVKWYGLISYGILVVVTVQILLYTYKAELITFKQNLIGSCKAGAVAPTVTENDVFMTPRLSKEEVKVETKFLEKKSMIVTNSQALILICMGIAFTVPMSVVRKLSREHLDTINYGSGKAWVYLNRIAVPTSYQFLFPLFIIASNAKMRTFIIRGIRELELSDQWQGLKTKIRNTYRRKVAPSEMYLTQVQRM